jgi:hypothetical protein
MYWIVWNKIESVNLDINFKRVFSKFEMTDHNDVTDYRFRHITIKKCKSHQNDTRTRTDFVFNVYVND